MITCSCHPRTAARLPRRHLAGADILRALNSGPRTLSQLAIGVYGDDEPSTIRRVSYVLSKYRDFVRSDGSGTWELAR